MKFKFNFDRRFKFKINDEVWEGYLITEEEAEELDSEEQGFRALTITDHKCMFIVEGNVTKNIVNHELLHVYVHYLSTESANLTVDQFEEIIAGFLENSLDTYMKKRNMIYRKFKKLEENY